MPRIISATRSGPIGALGVEIVERDVCSLMRLGCRGDDAGRRARLQPVEEELAEQKRRQVVDRPGQFDAVLRQLPCSVHRAGVVDEHIQLWIAGQHLGGQSAHRGLRREVGDECRHRRSPPGRRPDASRRNTRPGPAATDDGEVRAARGECFCRRQPNAIGGTRESGSACRSRHSNPRLWPRADDLFDGQGPSTKPTTDPWSVKTGFKARTGVEVVVKHEKPPHPTLDQDVAASDCGCAQYARCQYAPWWSMARKVGRQFIGPSKGVMQPESGTSAV